MPDSWSSLAPRSLTPHESHGSSHNAFAVAIGVGVVGYGIRQLALQKKERMTVIGIWGLPQNLMMLVASFLSSAEGVRPDCNCSPLKIHHPPTIH